MTISVIYDRKKKATKTIPGLIELRLTLNRKSSYITTGIKVLPSQYYAGAVVSHPNSEELNRRLRLLSVRIEELVNNQLEKGIAIDIAEIRRILYDGEADGSQSFLDWCNEQITDLGIAKRTADHYNCTVTRLEEFGVILRWADITVENILAFDAYLRARALPLLKKEQLQVAAGKIVPRKKMSTAGIYNYHKNLRALLNRAVVVGKLDVNPYTKLRGKFKRGDKENVEYLTDEEILRIMSAKFTGQEEVARDLFVFQMWTGLAYVDMAKFSIDDYKYIDGKWISINQRVKTGVPFVNQLLAPAVAVLEKYGMTLPHINPSDYNHLLKTVGAICNISTRMHSHLARHTFATYMLRHGVKLENLSKMLGHTNITQTQRYAKVLAKSVHEDFDMIAEKLKKDGI